MKRNLPNFLTLQASIVHGILVVSATSSLHAAIVLQNGVPYSQDFDSMPSSAGPHGRHTLPNWWTFSESGVGENTVYQVDRGEATVGDTYSYGSNSQSTRGDRALGILRNPFNSSTIGVSFINNVGVNMIDVTISYTGEQWRLGSAGSMDKIYFQYSINATSLTHGEWIDFDRLDFIAPNTVDPFGTVDGNADKNRTLLSGTISSLSVAEGGTFWIRWSDFDSANADYGLAVDDFRITAVPEVSTMGLFFLGLAGVYRRRRS